MKHAFWKLVRSLTPPKRKSWDDVSTRILMIFGLIATAEAGYYGYVLQKFVPDFLDLASGEAMSIWLNATSWLASASSLVLVCYFLSGASLQLDR